MLNDGNTPWIYKEVEIWIYLIDHPKTTLSKFIGWMEMFSGYL